MLMERQIVNLIETFVALIAIVAPLRGVNQLVILVVSFLVETFATILAFPIEATEGKRINQIIVNS